MSAPLVYLDQNIVSLQADGKVDFSRIDDVQWVYSSEHFAEIRRSSSPALHLDALDKLGARLLEIDLRNWNYSGSATLTERASAKDAYEKYLDANNDVPINTKELGVLMAWFNGGTNAEAVLRVPDALEEQMRQLLSALPSELVPDDIREVSEDFRRVLSEIVAHGNDIQRVREALGVGKGAAGSVIGNDPIRQIWEMISKTVPGQTCDQFFGFEPIEALHQSPWTAYEGVIRCCTMLDIVGYQAEKKSRDPEKIENVMSDAAHIAAGAFCTAVISADRRFSRRAKAIYEYKGISTASLLLNAGG